MFEIQGKKTMENCDFYLIESENTNISKRWFTLKDILDLDESSIQQLLAYEKNMLPLDME